MEFTGDMACYAYDTRIRPIHLEEQKVSNLTSGTNALMKTLKYGMKKVGNQMESGPPQEDK